MAQSHLEQYNARAQRIHDAVKLKIPDRIPITTEIEDIILEHKDVTWAEMMYDVEKAKSAAKRMYIDLDMDTHALPKVKSPGQVYDMLDFKQMKWAGAESEENRLRDPDSIYQFVEPGTGFEAMHPDEYDWFVNDPTDYMIRGFWPKVSKTLEPLKNLPAMWPINAYTRLSLFAPFGSPEVAKALQALVEIGEKASAFNQALLAYTRDMVQLGYPPRDIAACSQPFDFIGDYMRGTIGKSLDMYRNPDELKAAVDKVTPMILAQVLGMARSRLKFLEELMPEGKHTRNVIMYLHGGAGGLMSDEQFKEFYWPSLRALLMGIIDAGFTPLVFSEGVYDERLEIIRDLPRGKVLWHIETDIFKAKEVLGDTCCIEGGPPATVMNAGSVDDVRAYAKKLIHVCGKGGGFIMSTAQCLLSAKYENVKALIDFTKEYGVYQ